MTTSTIHAAEVASTIEHARCQRACSSITTVAPAGSPERVVPDNRLCWCSTRLLSLPLQGKRSVLATSCAPWYRARSTGRQNPRTASPGKSCTTPSLPRRSSGDGYTAWTPISKAPEIQDILGALDGRNPIDDIQYLLTVEGKRLVFRSTSVLDDLQGKPLIAYRRQRRRKGKR